MSRRRTPRVDDPLGATGRAAQLPAPVVYGSGPCGPDRGETLPVEVIGWSRHDAVALVDGVIVRIRRNRSTVRWICVQHGERTTPTLCRHTEALAVTSAPAHKFNGPGPLPRAWWAA